MYKQSTLDGDDMCQVALAPRPLGPAFTKAQVEQADQMEVWCSSFTDTLECTEFVLKKGGRVVANVVVPGY
jgi:hypothetical protein